MAFGLVLIFMGAPRLIAGLAQAPHDATLRMLARDPQQVSSDEIQAALLSYQEALRWTSSADLEGEIAAFHFRLALRLGFGSEAGQRALKASLTAATRAVYASPGLPYAWTYRTMALELLEGMTPATVASLRMSILTAPFQPQLFPARLSIGLRAWTSLDEATRALLAEQIVIAAQFDTKALSNAIQTPSQYRLVREILVDQPDLLQALEAVRG